MTRNVYCHGVVTLKKILLYFHSKIYKVKNTQIVIPTNTLGGLRKGGMTRYGICISYLVNTSTY